MSPTPQPGLHVVEHGERGGTPVLAVHGWTPDHRLMTGALEPLFAKVPGYWRLYPDLPGMGHSPIGDVSSASDMVDALEELVEQRLGSRPFVLVGESYGGYLSRELVRRRPEQVLGLALVCPVADFVDHAARTLPPRQVIRSDPALLARLDEDERAAFTEVAVVESAETLARFRADIAPGLAVADTEAMAGLSRLLPTPPEEGPVFERPTLFILGRQDDSVGYVDQWHLLEHYPRAAFVVLDAAGHNLQFEQPRLFEALIEEWLERAAAAAGA